MADLKVGALVTACWTAHASKAAWWTAFRFHAPDPVDRDELVMGVMPPSTPEAAPWSLRRGGSPER
jgi:hypothetical protein